MIKEMFVSFASLKFIEEHAFIMLCWNRMAVLKNVMVTEGFPIHIFHQRMHDVSWKPVLFSLGS